MKSELLAGVDVGSSNCKVGMYTAAGERLAQLSRPTARDCAALVRGVLEALVTVSATPPDAGRVDTGLSWNRHVDGQHWPLVSGFPGSGRVIAWAARLIGVEPDGFPEVRLPTGIVVEPYLDGRGAPAPDPGRRLALHGVTAEHGPAELAVAVLEAELMSGPALRGRGCCLCGVAACVGAALLAGRAIGLDPAPCCRPTSCRGTAIGSRGIRRSIPTSSLRRRNDEFGRPRPPIRWSGHGRHGSAGKPARHVRRASRRSGG